MLKKSSEKEDHCSEAIEYLQGKNEPYLELKRKQLEINAKKQNLCEGQHQDCHVVKISKQTP